MKKLGRISIHPEPVFERAETAWLCLSRLVVVGATCLTGCKPPPAAPTLNETQPVVVEEPPVNPEAVARSITPFYLVLFNRGFSTQTVETPDRYRLNSVSDFQVHERDPELDRRISDAQKATPPLSSVAAAYGVTDSAVVEALSEWAKFVSPTWRTQSPLSASSARDTVLAIVFRQAIQDADRRNYHRAHVLFTDMAHTMSEDSPLRQRAGRDVFARFFREVPDKARFEAFAGRLAAYSEAREKEVLLAGEHAAVLHAAGLTAASGFMRDQLLSQFDLITLPMINKAIQRGVSFGFQTPERVARVKQRLELLASALREGPTAEIHPARHKAIMFASNEAYQADLGAFEKLWEASSADAADDDTSAEQLLDRMATMERPISEWLKEKTLVTRHVPLLTLRQPMNYRFLEMISPLTYEASAKQFRYQLAARLPSEVDDLEKKVTDWCGGEPAADGLADGSMHSLLAWYWLERGRPEMARTALIAGGRELLERGKNTSREDVVRLQDAAAEKLLDELNGYRFLIAAAEIEAAPAGAVQGTGVQYLPELAVLLAHWQQMWKDCALPPFAVDLIVGLIEEQVAQREAATGKANNTQERYWFWENRFTNGVVPDVVVERALEQNIFGPDGNRPVAPSELQAFFRDFRWPNEFSPGSKQRWKANATRGL